MRSTTCVEGLHVLVDDDPRWPQDPVAQARAACAGGAAVVQLRCKHATDRQTLDWAEAIREITRASGALFFVNDRFDLALACAADGVHLGQEDLAPARLPEALRRRLRIGRSTHDLAEARCAAQQLVDYVAFGPLFATTSKQSTVPARGLPALAEVVEVAAPLPVVAIGGIGPGNAAEVARAGARGVAVLSAVAAAPDPEAATRALVRGLASGWAARESP